MVIFAAFVTVIRASTEGQTSNVVPRTVTVLRVSYTRSTVALVLRSTIG
jgi:hypothetical protein